MVTERLELQAKEVGRFVIEKGYWFGGLAVVDPQISRVPDEHKAAD